MRKIRAILTMKWGEKLSNRKIASSAGVSSSTVYDCILRAKNAGLSWPLSDDVDDEQLEQKLYPSVVPVPSSERGIIDCQYIHKELKRKGMTLTLLWLEYKERYPNGYRYSHYCEIYRTYREKLDVWMRQTHTAGEKLFIDYAGMIMLVVVNKLTGETKTAQIFVAVCGASGYFYVEATFTQSLPDWIQSHCNAFEFFGGVTELLVPDNLKSGVKKPHLYDPDTNPSYHEMAKHFGCVVMPARVRSPKDKAKAEQVVQQVERQILAPLRNQQFFSLVELNNALHAKAKEVNEKPFQKLSGSRKSLFDEIEKNALKPLPTVPYSYAEWSYARAGKDYHVEIDGHHYSVPYKLNKKQLDIRLTTTVVECFYQNKRVASHVRSYDKRKNTTRTEHMPANHQEYAKWTPQAVIDEAKKMGESTQLLVERHFEEGEHALPVARTCLGILRLGKQYTEQCLEAACKRAIAINSLTYRSIESILKNHLDQLPLPDENVTSCSEAHQKLHEHVRGDAYYA